jgi:hypothetical protein
MSSSALATTISARGAVQVLRRQLQPAGQLIVIVIAALGVLQLHVAVPVDDAADAGPAAPGRPHGRPVRARVVVVDDRQQPVFFAERLMAQPAQVRLGRQDGVVVLQRQLIPPQLARRSGGG